MKWEFAETDDVSAVVSLYREVFNEELSPEELAARSSGKKLHYYLLKFNGESAGFAVFLGSGESAELWQAGIIPSLRNRHGGDYLITQSKAVMAEEGYSILTVSTFNRWDTMLRLLIRNGFRIVRTEYSERWNDLKIELQIEMRIKREIRYAVTEKCNFDCLFCHNEGLGHGVRKNRNNGEILNILAEAVTMGYTDITLTGGEPLYGDKKRLYGLLQGLGALPAPPDITLVTNGSLLNEEDVERMKEYPGAFKLHVSLHAADPDSFAFITRQPSALFQVVKANIRRASDAGLVVKVNCVLLKGINHDRIPECIETARDMGAGAIKFLELLVLPDSADDYGMYYVSGAIRKDLTPIATRLKSSNMRRELYRLNSDHRFTIELQKLTCALGCSHCRELRDRTFSSDMSYHPCLVRDKQHYHIRDAASLAEGFRNGDRIIDGYAFRFKDSSPTLIKQEEFVAGKKEFYFRIDNPDMVRGFLLENGFSLERMNGYHLEHYRPRRRSGEWDRFERILKIGWDSHDQSKTGLIFTDHAYRADPEFGMEVVSRYLDGSGPMNFPTADAARRFLDRLDFEPYLTIDLTLEAYRHGQYGSVNLSSDRYKPTLKMSGEEHEMRHLMSLLEKYGGEMAPLLIPFAQYMCEA